MVYRAYTLDANMAKSPLILQDALDQVRHCACSDQRDEIYAVLNLVEEHHKRLLKPDISKPTREIFRHVVLHDLMKSGSFSLLIHCEMREDSTGMPTWIPDWTVPRACSRIDNLAAFWDSRVQAQYLLFM